jgi:superfamily II DNA or RNA helicase
VSDERRFFSGTERAALYLADDGRCARCGVELAKGFHADHRQPYSKGGATDVANASALCPQCNLRKGDSVPITLRPWQKEALLKYEAESRRDFLVVATPGAGKTNLAGAILQRLRRREEIARAVIVVPTEHLKLQWAEAMDNFGLDFEPRWNNAAGAFPSDMLGIVVTYQQVASGAGQDIIRRHVAEKRTFAVFDEIHHCGDDPSLSWGEAIRYAFEPAIRRLALSGTPFRSDDYRIPFVRYVDGTGQHDVLYGYGEAVRDQHCRKLWFPATGGQMEWNDRFGERRVATFDDDLPADRSRERLRTAIDADGEWIRSVLHDANERLTELRETDSRAGALVLAIDQRHAERVAKVLAEVTGRSAVVAVSEYADASQRIKAFRESSEPWLVAVRMVSEGVDIPRLRVAVYATNIVKELFFRQAVGRVIRGSDDAYVFIPDDPTLREFAKEIGEQRDHVLTDEVDLLLGSKPGKPPGPDGPDSQFAAIRSEAEDSGVIGEGRHLTVAEMRAAEELRRQTPYLSILTPEAIALVLHARGDVSDTAQPESLRESPLRDRKQQLRKLNRKFVARINTKWGVPHNEINLRLNKVVGISGVTDATGEVELERRLELALRWFNDGHV